ncbi:MAG: phage/plasmid primase, P4 family [Gaiellaceae bacterium]
MSAPLVSAAESWLREAGYLCSDEEIREHLSKMEIDSGGNLNAAERKRLLALAAALREPEPALEEPGAERDLDGSAAASEAEASTASDIDLDFEASVPSRAPELPVAVTSQAKAAPALRLTDYGNAERIVHEHGRDLRFAPGLGWLAWDGRRWKRDADGEAMRRTKRTIRALYALAAEIDESGERARVAKWATTCEAQPRLAAAVKLAETELEVIVTADDLDAERFLLNVQNGTIDLRTGKLREHRREDLLTKLADVVFVPDARSELFERFLEHATGGDPELRVFLQRAAGYSLTGDTSEEVLFFAHGPTATGKSTLIDALQGAFGEYAETADFETFLKRHGDAGIRNDIARLKAARLVVSIEVDEGKALAEGLLKLLTGGDRIAARFLYSELFEFRPAMKLWLAANQRPRVNADDDAIWRRIIQIPFLARIPKSEQDPEIKRALRDDPAEHTAVLAWAVQGALDWQRHSLGVPELVERYTSEYRAENDLLGDWVADCLTLEPIVTSSAKELRASYESWCEVNGEKPIRPNLYGAMLKAKGCDQYRGHGGTRHWQGVRVNDPPL